MDLDLPTSLCLGILEQCFEEKLLTALQQMQSIMSKKVIIAVGSQVQNFVRFTNDLIKMNESNRIEYMYSEVSKDGNKLTGASQYIMQFVM